jgi:DNA-binding NarL/FixJ family response regulator
VKTLIVDDHPIVRAGLNRLLAAIPEIEVYEAATGKDALAIFRERHPDLVVIDLNLPGLGGLEVIARMKVADPEIRILVLSMHGDPLHAACALEAGAVGYISKNAAPEEILEAIRRIADGHTYIEREIAEELVFAKIRTPTQQMAELSARELEMLRLLAEGRTLSQIAETIGISYKTVANNFSQLRARLGAASTAELIRTAIQLSLRDR